MIENVGEGIIALGLASCALMVIGGLAFLVKLLIVDPLRHRRKDKEELARLSLIPSKNTAEVTKP